MYIRWNSIERFRQDSAWGACREALSIAGERLLRTSRLGIVVSLEVQCGWAECARAPMGPGTTTAVTGIIGLGTARQLSARHEGET